MIASGTQTCLPTNSERFGHKNVRGQNLVSKFKNKNFFSEVGMKNKLQKHDQKRETLSNKINVISKRTLDVYLCFSAAV